MVVPSLGKSVLLSSLLHPMYQPGQGIGDLGSQRCSHCCPHPRNCPGIGDCQDRDTLATNALVSTPNILFIGLNRLGRLIFLTYIDLQLYKRGHPDEQQ